MTDWSARIRDAFAARGRVPDDDVVEELAQHARAMYEAARADGRSAGEASQAVDVQIALWSDDAALLRRRQEGRTQPLPAAAAAPSWSSGLAHDVRYAGRMFRRQSAFTLLVVATMALGIGATTILFSVTYGVLLKPFPWAGADRLVVLEETRGGHRPRFSSFSNAAYLAWNERATTIDGLAAYAPRTMTMTGIGDPERIRVTAATASLFSLLDVRPVAGTLFREADEAAADGRVVVLAEGLWRRLFAADPSAIGRIVHLDGEAHRVAGVVADAVAFPDRETRAWVPFRVVPATGNYLSMFGALARLKPGATPAQAAAEGTARGRFAPDTGMTTTAIFGAAGPIEVSATRLGEAATAHVRRPVLVLLAAVVLLLMTATGNVASLQLARAATRTREMAIRAALGAGATRVTRQLLIESVTLGLAGGLAGLAVAVLAHRYLPVVLPADFPRAADVGVNATVVAFALALSVVVSVLFGVLPALRARRVNLVESLTADGSAPVGFRRRSRLAQTRAAIIAVQVAIACVLLVGASLLGRSFIAMIEADRGYDPSGLLTARLSLPAPLYPPERRHAILRQILDRLARAPGAVDAAFTSEHPLVPGGSTSAFTLRAPALGGSAVSVQASPRIVSPRALHALGMRLIAGRDFSESDTESSQPVVVVNRAFARTYLGDQPLGSQMPMGVGYLDADAAATVIGVVDDVRYVTASDASQPELFYSYRQFGGRLPVGVVHLLLRTSGEPMAHAAALRAAVRDADRNLAPEAVMTMDERVLTSLARPRLYAVLLGIFALLAVLIAAVGLFAVLSYVVGQRTRELAVRAALGARRVDIVRLVIGQGLLVSGAGIAAGLAASAAVSRVLAALLYGITLRDPLTYAAVPLLLILVAAAACAGPARRAARLDPWRLLKSG